jgi:flagellar biosynthesis component FlhA
MNFRASARYLAWRLTGSKAQGAAGAQTIERPAVNEEPAAAINAALSLAQGLSKSSVQNEGQVAALLSRIESARRSFADARGMYVSPESVLSELDAALQHVHTALDALKAGDGETAKRREEWAAARLKRAADRVRRR